MPPDELARAVHNRISLRDHRQTVQIPPDIVGKLIDGRVAALGFLTQRHPNNGSDLTLDRFRIDAAHHALDLGGRRTLELVRSTAADELVEYGAERVDVGRDGRGFTPHLFGTRVV